MEKFIIEVPAGIRYISDWEDFSRIFPNEQHIMDKQIPGCGYTEYCIRSSENTIICSPRNMLILNKWEQHPGEVFRVHNDLYDLDPCIDKDISDERVSKSESDTINAFLKKLKLECAKADQSFTDKLNRELKEYFQLMDARNLPYKILVTYDSFRILKDILKNMGNLDIFRVVVDEFQSIFTDSRFKSSTENEFVGQLQDLKRVCYLSATPMMDKYLEMIPEFRDLPFYELDWESKEPRRVRKPDLKVRVVKSIYEPARKIIESYKLGKFETRMANKAGKMEVVQSTEAMIFVNSVNNIIGIIKRNGLRPEEVNILCSNTPINQEKIDKTIGHEYLIGRVPLEGEPRKMFTFCTRTVYLGADFYSDNARTFILSDSNIDCLAVDISLDLPQILGRQRLDENPWKNSAEFYYKPLTAKNKKNLDPEEFERILKEKEEKSLKKLENYDAAPNKKIIVEDYDKITKYENYKEDYICINTHSSNYPIPEINHLVMIAEKRSFDIQQIDYVDRFSVFDAIGNAVYNGNDEISQESSNFLAAFSRLEDKNIVSRLKFICEAGLSRDAYREVALRMDEITRQYMVLGPDKIRACGYNVTTMKKELGIATFSEADLELAVISEFKVGDIIGRNEIKGRLKNLYDNLEYGKTAKASDINKWFYTKRARILVEGKIIEGFELIKRKENLI